MKKILAICMLMFTVALSASAQYNSSNADITASFDRIWTEHNVYQNGVKGMMLHAKFRVVNAYNQSGKVIAYFHYNDGTALKDFNGQYCTNDGKVCVSSAIRPGYKDTTYDNLSIFMPYEELHMGSGRSELNYRMQIYINNKYYASSSTYNFTYTKN